MKKKNIYCIYFKMRATDDWELAADGFCLNRKDARWKKHNYEQKCLCGYFKIYKIGVIPLKEVR